PNTELIELTVEAGDAYLAAELANALAEILMRRGEEMIDADIARKRQALEPQLLQAAHELSAAQNAYDDLAAQTVPISEGAESKLAAMLLEINQRRELYGLLLSQYESLRTRAVVQTNS